MHRNSRHLLPASFCLAIALVMLAPKFSQAEAQDDQGYEPTPFVPVDLPKEIVLSPRVRTNNPAGLFARDCFYDSIQNRMAFGSDISGVGVRVLRVKQDVNFEVEFTIRVESRAAKFRTNGSTATGVSTPTSITMPNGFQRVLVRGRAFTNKVGFAQINSDQDVNWRLISARLRRR